MIPLPFTLEMNKVIELRAVLTNTSLIVTGFVLSVKSAKAPHPEQRRDELEIRPVLLQLGVVHVNCKHLETYTNTYSQCDRATWTLPQDNRRNVYFHSKKYAS